MIGTITQVNGNTLTVTDRQQNDYTIAVTSDTKIIQSGTASSDALKAGMDVSVMGATNNGIVAAIAIAVYSPGILRDSTNNGSNL